MTRTKQSVVAGVDGSEPSAQAALWAAAEAQRQQLPLHLISIVPDPGRESYAKTALHDVGAVCKQAVSDLEITEETGFGHPAEEMVHRSASARLVVVGSRGHGTLHEMLLGSISAAVAAHASSPVVVVRGRGTTESGPVVVGVDDSTGNRTALHFAFEAAQRRRCELVAVQALPDAYFIPGPYDHPNRDELLAAANKHLDQHVESWSRDFPEVAVRQVVSNAPPVQALLETAQQARLLVVGRRGTGGFTGLLVGSVARGVLHHAPCPVAVVPS